VVVYWVSEIIISVAVYMCNWLVTYLVTYLLTYSLQHSPSSETNQFSATQEIPHVLWNPKVHYRIHKFPSPVPILSQINLLHTPTSHFPKMHLNIYLTSTPGSSKWPLPLRFPHPNPAYTSSLSHACYITRPSHSALFDHPNNISASWLVKLICSQIT